MVGALKVWKVNITASKRNVFFTLSDPNNKVRKLITPGVLRKKGMTKLEYKKLDDRKLRRKKRSLRLYLNRQKTSRPACAQTWGLVHAYIRRKRLKTLPFIITVGGSNLRLSRHLAQKIVLKKQFPVRQIFVKQFLSHNGCPQRIKKRKKNKGKNKRRKRDLFLTSKKLRKARDVALNIYKTGVTAFAGKNTDYLSWIWQKRMKVLHRNHKRVIRKVNHNFTSKWFKGQSTKLFKLDKASPPRKSRKYKKKSSLEKNKK